MDYKEISWLCFLDNRAIRGYRNFLKKHGGRECAHYRKVERLQDGKYMTVFRLKFFKKNGGIDA